MHEITNSFKNVVHVWGICHYTFEMLALFLSNVKQLEGLFCTLSYSLKHKRLQIIRKVHSFELHSGLCGWRNHPIVELSDMWTDPPRWPHPGWRHGNTTVKSTEQYVSREIVLARIERGPNRRAPPRQGPALHNRSRFNPTPSRLKLLLSGWVWRWRRMSGSCWRLVLRVTRRFAVFTHR